MDVRLRISNGKVNIKEVLIGPETIIGRSTDCNLRIASSQVSRRHCRIRVSDEVVSVCDLGSGNGTLLNGEQLPPHEEVSIRPSSALVIGPLKFTVLFTPPELLGKSRSRVDVEDETPFDSEESTLLTGATAANSHRDENDDPQAAEGLSDSAADGDDISEDDFDPLPETPPARGTSAAASAKASPTSKSPAPAGRAPATPAAGARGTGAGKTVSPGKPGLTAAHPAAKKPPVSPGRSPATPSANEDDFTEGLFENPAQKHPAVIDPHSPGVADTVADLDLAAEARRAAALAASVKESHPDRPPRLPRPKGAASRPPAAPPAASPADSMDDSPVAPAPSRPASKAPRVAPPAAAPTPQWDPGTALDTSEVSPAESADTAVWTPPLESATTPLPGQPAEQFAEDAPASLMFPTEEGTFFEPAQDYAEGSTVQGYPDTTYEEAPFSDSGFPAGDTAGYADDASAVEQPEFAQPEFDPAAPPAAEPVYDQFAPAEEPYFDPAAPAGDVAFEAVAPAPEPTTSAPEPAKKKGLFGSLFGMLGKKKKSAEAAAPPAPPQESAAYFVPEGSESDAGTYAPAPAAEDPAFFPADPASSPAAEPFFAPPPASPPGKGQRKPPPPAPSSEDDFFQYLQ